ncbi:MAG: hypothetical protein ABEI32_10805 [Halothece sp.]
MNFPTRETTCLVRLTVTIFGGVSRLIWQQYWSHFVMKSVFCEVVMGSAIAPKAQLRLLSNCFFLLFLK